MSHKTKIDSSYHFSPFLYNLSFNPYFILLHNNKTNFIAWIILLPSILLLKFSILTKLIVLDVK
jgi:hypothetical protein